MKNKDGRITWEADGPMAQLFGDASCHLCGAEGEVYRKGHLRKNGIMLESSLKYCKSCDTDRRDECDKDFEKWWAEKWASCEATAEKNWQEHGIYTNVSYSGHPSGLSTHFAYVKREDGTFRPYRHVHPENARDEWERDASDTSRKINGDPSLSEEQKFDQYLKFLREYKSEDTLVARLVEMEVKRIEDRMAFAEDHES